MTQKTKAAKKPTAKPAAKKVAPKPAAKKPAAKKPVLKKPAAKKPAAKPTKLAPISSAIKKLGEEKRAAKPKVVAQLPALFEAKTPSAEPLPPPQHWFVEASTMPAPDATFEPTCRSSYGGHIALEFARGNKWSEFMAFTGEGLQRDRILTKDFFEEYSYTINQPLSHSVVALLGSVRRGFSPDFKTVPLLFKIGLWEASRVHTGTGVWDINDAKQSVLILFYNSLSKALGVKMLSSSTSKEKAVKALQDLELAISTPSATQVKAQEAVRLKAAVRLASLIKPPKEPNMAKATAAKKPAAKAASKATAKPAAKGAKPAAAKATTKKGADAAPKKRGIGAFCIGLIEAGKSNEEILTAVKKDFPDANTSSSSIAWYRNKLKNG